AGHQRKALAGVLGERRHPVAGPDAEREQPLRDPVGLGVEVRVGPVPVRGDERDRVTLFAGMAPPLRQDVCLHAFVSSCGLRFDATLTYSGLPDNGGSAGDPARPAGPILDPGHHCIFPSPSMNNHPPSSLPTSSWRIAALPAAGGGLVLWLFMSRLAH